MNGLKVAVVENIQLLRSKCDLESINQYFSKLELDAPAPRFA
jgi:hypothetical protein